MKGFMNLSIRKKILTVFAGVLIFIIGLGGMSYTSLNNMVSDQIPLVVENESLAIHMLELRKHEKDFFRRIESAYDQLAGLVCVRRERAGRTEETRGYCYSSCLS